MNPFDGILLKKYCNVLRHITVVCLSIGCCKVLKLATVLLIFIWHACTPSCCFFLSLEALHPGTLLSMMAMMAG